MAQYSWPARLVDFPLTLGRRLAEIAGEPSLAAVTRECLKILGYENGNHQPTAKGLHALAEALQAGLEQVGERVGLEVAGMGWASRSSCRR
ncbi:hypothetical protein GCM10009531_71080 [Actinoplanes capillaceus]